MRSIALLFAALLTAGAAHAQVYKCPGPNGKTIYSDAPCTDGRTLDENRLRGNMLQGARPELPPADAPGFDAATAHAIPAKCRPDATAVRNLEVSASSITLKPIDKQIANEDIRRARACEPLMTEQEKDAMRFQLQDAARERRAVRQPSPTMLVNCDTAGCWDTAGTRYNKAAGNTFFRQDGKACQLVGQQLSCP